MNTSKKMIVAGIALALGMSSSANAAAQKEEDSAYEWGRWAVLSPAAGGDEPYIAALEPGAVNNARPGDADEFDPEVERPDPIDNPTVEAFCTAGSNCGYATYYKQLAEDDGPEFNPEAAVEGYDQSDNNPGGPVLARFNLDATALDQPDDDTDGTDFEPTAVAGGQDGEPQSVNFEVFGTNDPDFPDIESVEMEGTDSYTGTDTSNDIELVTDEGDTFIRVTQTSHTSTLDEQHDFNNVDTGAWSDDQQTRTTINNGEGQATMFDFFSSGGHFAFGRTATFDEMQRFSAGNVTAVYQGVVLDYNSRVTMEFDLGNDTVVGRFASENGFNGFEAAGAVDGVNFSAEDGANGFVGSFFSGGENVSGAVKNATQLGVYSADHVRPAR